MNKCLLAKWIFKLESGQGNLCCKLLRKKYLGQKGFFSCTYRGSSQFWKGLQEAGESCLRGLSYIVNNRKKRFWRDVWLGECLLKIQFPDLYSISNQQGCSVSCKMLCGLVESTDHILFRCATAQFIWCVFRDTQGWPLLKSISDFQERVVEGACKKDRKFSTFILGCITWSLWLVTNDFVFNKIKRYDK
jgi:hypothetical protein